MDEFYNKYQSEVVWRLLYCHTITIDRYMIHITTAFTMWSFVKIKGFSTPILLITTFVAFNLFY